MPAIQRAAMTRTAAMTPSTMRIIMEVGGVK
jgi:hypothetical protein